MSFTGDKLFYNDGTAMNFSLYDFFDENEDFLQVDGVISKIASFIVSRGLVEAVKSPNGGFLYKGVEVEVKTCIFEYRKGRLSFDFQHGLNKNAVYVLCAFGKKKDGTRSPLLLENWSFVVVSGRTIEDGLKANHSLGIDSLLYLSDGLCPKFYELADAVDKVIGGL